jgi:hypothetical protein
MQSKPNLNTTDKSFVAENDALLEAVRHLIEQAPSDPALAFDPLPQHLLNGPGALEQAPL